MAGGQSVNRENCRCINACVVATEDRSFYGRSAQTDAGVSQNGACPGAAAFPHNQDPKPTSVSGDGGLAAF